MKNIFRILLVSLLVVCFAFVAGCDGDRDVVDNSPVANNSSNSNTVGENQVTIEADGTLPTEVEGEDADFTKDEIDLSGESNTSGTTTGSSSVTSSKPSSNKNNNSSSESNKNSSTSQAGSSSQNGSSSSNSASSSEDESVGGLNNTSDKDTGYKTQFGWIR